jgi:DNA polymerase-3 subunit epsilon
MLQTLIDLTAMAEALSRSADYRVLQRLVPRAACQPTIGQDCRTGTLDTETLDTETTGLDHDKDEITLLCAIVMTPLSAKE